LLRSVLGEDAIDAYPIFVVQPGHNRREITPTEQFVDPRKTICLEISNGRAETVATEVRGEAFMELTLVHE
jgi:hypothetical protein